MTSADDGWEARMSARAKQRAAERERAEAEQSFRGRMQRTEFAITAGRPWLNGWPRDLRTVLIGSGVHCICCGRLAGVTCVAFPEDWVPPGPEPVWPFGQDDCPLCCT